MIKYTKIYSGGIPNFKEEDIFTTIIPLNLAVNAPANEPVNEHANVYVNEPFKINNIQNLIIVSIRENNNITQTELSKKLKVNESTVKISIGK